MILSYWKNRVGNQVISEQNNNPGTKGIIESICVSKHKGNRKYSVEKAFLEKNVGILNDAHGDGSFRQVSFLSKDRINKFQEISSIKIEEGIFGENIITKGLDLIDFSLRSEFFIGDSARIVIVQHGKTCHDNLCPIAVETGNCIMPEYGSFAKIAAKN